MVGQEILVLFIMVRIRAPQPPFASATLRAASPSGADTKRSATRSFNEVWHVFLHNYGTFLMFASATLRAASPSGADTKRSATRSFNEVWHFICGLP